VLDLDFHPLGHFVVEGLVVIVVVESVPLVEGFMDFIGWCLTIIVEEKIGYQDGEIT